MTLIGQTNSHAPLWIQEGSPSWIQPEGSSGNLNYCNQRKGQWMLDGPKPQMATTLSLIKSLQYTHHRRTLCQIKQRGGLLSVRPIGKVAMFPGAKSWEISFRFANHITTFSILASISSILSQGQTGSVWCQRIDFADMQLKTSHICFAKYLWDQRFSSEFMRLAPLCILKN